MSQLVFCVEGPSEKALLAGLLPRILPDHCQYHVIPFEGKRDMEQRLLMIMRGWRTPNTAFLILRDQDSADCETVKGKLTDICAQSGRGNYLVRIACHELESFYLGDLAAVEQGLRVKGLARAQGKAKYRVPDQIAGPGEELKRLTGGRFQKLQGARAIGPHLSLDGNRSCSFSQLLSGIETLTGSIT